METTNQEEEFDHWQDDDFLNEIKGRLDDFESGKDEGLTWEEIMLKAKKRLN